MEYTKPAWHNLQPTEPSGDLNTENLWMFETITTDDDGCISYSVRLIVRFCRPHRSKQQAKGFQVQKGINSRSQLPATRMARSALLGVWVG